MTHPGLIELYANKGESYQYRQLRETLKKIVFHVFYRNRLLNTSIDCALDDFVSEFVIKQSASDLAPKGSREILAWVHQCAVNRVTTKTGKRMRLIELHAITFVQKLARGSSSTPFEMPEDKESSFVFVYNQIEYSASIAKHPNIESEIDSCLIVDNFKRYLHSVVQAKEDLLKWLRYLDLRLKGIKPVEAQKIMGFTPRQRDYAQQALHHHYKKFVQRNGVPPKYGRPRTKKPLSETITEIHGIAPKPRKENVQVQFAPNELANKAKPKQILYPASITLLSPNGNFYEVETTELTKFGRRVGLRTTEIKSLALREIEAIKGWRIVDDLRKEA